MGGIEELQSNPRDPLSSAQLSGSSECLVSFSAVRSRGACEDRLDDDWGKEGQRYEAPLDAAGLEARRDSMADESLRLTYERRKVYDDGDFVSAEFDVQHLTAPS